MSENGSAVIAAAEDLGDALAAEREELGRVEFFDLVMRCNQAIERETGIDYGSVCSDDGCC
ncbi:MAG: halo-CC-star protein HcsS [Halodesulfurarchaeum sp.]|nr:halo-CC-star protein HcsS [Halodesulfurarchaeum sp.]